MKHTLTAAALIAIGTAGLAQAAPVRIAAPQAPTMAADFAFGAGGAEILQVKDNGKGKGKKAGKVWRKEREKAGKAYRKAHENAARVIEKQERKVEKALGTLVNPEGRQSDGRFVIRSQRTDTERRNLVDTLLSARAPEDRDMTRILSAVPLALIGRDVAIASVPEEELLTYRNCPPGLAKKDPPCVPPGLARKGVTYEEWVAYDDDEIDDLLTDRRDSYLDDDDGRIDDFPEDRRLLLSSQEIARLFALDPAPEGQRYALIDGMPVLVDSADYRTLVTVSELARVADLGDMPRVAPTAALSQDELRRIYRLPAARPGENYAVLNGELIALDDEAYETLQLIRVARAVF